jgi:hypothetical protein
MNDQICINLQLSISEVKRLVAMLEAQEGKGFADHYLMLILAAELEKIN